ncbi:hypothetical protein L3X38_024119 [Prunus dulcis]|uniref:Uncharacterized protein n=1 Tax=Prunus dulcis TaxID=3755 RepID=A0AAD4W011_PRUDU|nr:hypothetical protein L3X38_024119 [Prunus dulcis]
MKDYTFKIVKEALNGCPMNMGRLVHKLGKLVHIISNVGPVKLRHCRAPNILRYMVASAGGEPSWRVKESETCLVPVNTTIKFLLDTKNPLTPNQILVRPSGSQLPGSIPNQSCKIIIHGTASLRVSSGLRDTYGLKGGRDDMFSDEMDLLGFKDVVLRACVTWRDGGELVGGKGGNGNGGGIGAEVTGESGVEGKDGLGGVWETGVDDGG